MGYTYRKSEASDGLGIIELINSRFGMIQGDMIDDINGKYTLCINENGRIAGLCSIRESCKYKGYELGWGCVSKEEEHKGIMTNIIQQLLDEAGDNETVYANCWRTVDHLSKAHIDGVLRRLGFDIKWKCNDIWDTDVNCYSHSTCTYYKDNNGHCRCFQDLYIREGKRE